MNLIEKLDLVDELESFETSVSTVIQKSLDRRTSVFIDPNLEIRNLNYDGVRYSKRYRDLFTLIILTWYSDYFQGFESYVRYEIGEYLEHLLIFPELSASLVSQESCCLVMSLFISEYGSNDFFGNVVSSAQINRVLDRITLKMFFPSKVKKSIYRRGYKDKGSLRPETQWLPKDDWSYREIQLQLEEKRLEYHSIVTRLVRVAGDWVLRRRLVRQEE